MSLTAKNVTIQKNNKLICRDFNITIKPGEIWGILGSNGSGKTTLLHSLSGIEPLKAGDIYLQEKNLKQLSLKKIAQQLGILFQSTPLAFPQTIWDYCLAARFPYQRYFSADDLAAQPFVQEALQIVELEEAQDRLITDLSGGEKKRLALASLLIQTPQIYLLDEPTNDLDVYQQMKILNHFTYLAKEKAASIVMVLHDINLAQHFCDSIVLLFEEGKIISGRKVAVLTEENLQQLYRHPLERIKNGERIFWQPAIML